MTFLGELVCGLEVAEANWFQGEFINFLCLYMSVREWYNSGKLSKFI